MKLERGEFLELVEYYKRAVLGIAWVCIGNLALARQISLEVFQQFSASFVALKKRENLSAWIGALTIGTCRRWNRRYVRVQRDGEELGDLFLRLQRLPESNRFVLVLRYYARMSYKEIGAFLDLPLNTVRGTMYKATQRWLLEFSKDF
ncbi:MAG: hypothetical protein D6805_00785 [Planctomycetota bacterium]|nr:MAG: hypothetical protein D6805_00785 [Planctomycetota bacterium]